MKKKKENMNFTNIESDHGGQLHEIHITVSVEDGTNLENFCNQNKIKRLIINNSQGDSPIQHEISYYRVADIETVKKIMRSMCSKMRDNGMKVIRQKIEVCGFKNRIVYPNFGLVSYYEYHVRIPTGKRDQQTMMEMQHMCGSIASEIKNKSDLKVRIAVGTSCNLLKPDNSGYIITMRVFNETGRNFVHYDKSIDDFFESFRKSIPLLKDSLHEEIKTIYEMVVFDDNIYLDSNWVTII